MTYESRMPSITGQMQQIADKFGIEAMVAKGIGLLAGVSVILAKARGGNQGSLPTSLFPAPADANGY